MGASTGTPWITALSTFQRSGGLFQSIGAPITSATFRRGQRKLTDGLSAGTAVLTGRKPEDMAGTPLIGMPMTLRLNMKLAAGGSVFQTFAYRVADYRINYGRTVAEDTWEMELEDAFAYLGRATLPTTVITNGTSTDAAADTVALAAGLSQSEYGTTTTKTSGQTVTNENALDVYQTMVNTEGAKVIAGGDTIFWYSRNYWIYNSTVHTFTDTGAANTYKFTTYEARSVADNYAEKVIVRPRGSSDVISGTGIFSYNLDAYAFDTQQAQNLADFMRGALDVDLATPTVIGMILNGQDTDILNVFAFSPQSATVTFRGTTTVNQILGFQINVSPEETRAELYLANSDFLNYVILDDTTYGKLDYNRLGW